MRYLALAFGIAVVLAVAAPCPAEGIEFTTTLTPTTMDMTVELTLEDQAVHDHHLASDTVSSDLTGTQDIRLNCDFDPTSHDVTSVNDIVFVLGFSNMNLTSVPSLHLSFTYYEGGPEFAYLDLAGDYLGGSLSTGRQDHDNFTPDPSPVDEYGEFDLDRDPIVLESDGMGEQGDGDVLFYLNNGTFIITGEYYTGPIGMQWWFNSEDPNIPEGESGSEAWNNGNDLEGNGTVSVSLSGIAAGLATYDVEVSVPVQAADIVIPNPGMPGPDPLGHVFCTATLEFTGQFTREVSTPLIGDANGDDVVDEGDASILGAHWLQTNVAFTSADGDFNGDHVVNDKDAAILAAHWGDTQTGGAVPEPSTLVLLLGLALAGLVAWRRR